MRQPKMCPICGEIDLRIVLRNARFMAEAEGNRFTLSDVFAYGCNNGHIFASLSEQNPVIENLD